MSILTLGLGQIVETVGKLADDLHTSDKERAAADLDAYRAETERLATQVEVNKVEAASTSLWVSGWRPAVGWVGVMAMLYQFVAYPVLVWGWSAAQAAQWVPPTLTAPPMLDTDALWVILTGILGIGGMRSAEKVKGVAR